MAKKYISKTLSVGLSLALCASLVAPSFAASFMDLQNAFNGAEEHKGITVTDNGDGSRTITLEEEVTRTGNEGSVGVHGKHGSVILDLNGYTINGNPTDSKKVPVFDMDGGELTIQDNSEEKTGSITGGYMFGNGGGIVVGGGSLTLESGSITGNTSTGSGGGVCVKNNGTFTMKGGQITGNTANGNSNSGGGGVHVFNGGEFIMEGGSIAGNQTPNGANGVGVAVHKDGTFTMNGGEITGDVTVDGENSAVQVHNSSFTMNNGTILGNISVTDAGDGSKTSVAINGGTVSEMKPSEGKNYLDGNHGLVKNEDGTYNVQELGPDGHIWGAWAETPAEIGIEGSRDRHCLVDGCGETQHEAIPALVPTPAPVVEIDEPEVPLASGPVTRAEFIDYLWRHEDEPESDGVCTFTDVAEDHDFILALGWGEQNGVAEADGEGNFQPDELVTVAAVREFLGNFARVFGMDTDVYALATLAGEDGEAVLNCDEVLAEFFGEE